MHCNALFGAVVLFTGGFAAAQQVLVPRDMALAAPGLTTLVWRNTAFRCSLVYDTSHFTAQGVTGPVTIQNLAFRPLNREAWLAGQQWAGVTIKMSSSPLDYTVANTLFSAWQGVNVQTVFSGTVTLLAAAGGAPNDYALQISLSPPFVYNPALGLDLNIDIEAPNAPSIANAGYFAASSTTANGLARRLSTPTIGSTTGTISGFAAVCRIGFTGPGGYGSIQAAKAIEFGASCTAVAESFYQAFPEGDAFDLRGSPAKSLLLLPSGTGYIVSSGSIAPDLSKALGVPDVGDDTNVHIALSNPFPTISMGSVTDLTVANGYVSLGNDVAVDGDPSPTVGACWHRSLCDCMGRPAQRVQHRDAPQRRPLPVRGRRQLQDLDHLARSQ